MITKIKLLLFIFFFLTQCGYKVIDKSFSRYNLINVETEGYKKINFYIKNELANNIKNENNINISINIATNRIKDIEEKNIKNEITKYRVQINTNIELYFIDDNKTEKFKISSSGSYKVEDTSVKTSKNLDNLEKKLTKNILRELNQKLLILSDDS